MPSDLPNPPTPELDAALADATEQNDTSRRDALRKLGVLAAWTAPVTLTLLTSARADEFGSPCLPPGPCP